MKKVIKLINNERTNNRIMSKSSTKMCDSTSFDRCEFLDSAHCTVYAYDNCAKDLAACINGADDYCASFIDVKGCFGAGEIDNDD